MMRGGFVFVRVPLDDKSVKHIARQYVSDSESKPDVGLVRPYSLSL